MSIPTTWPAAFKSGPPESPGCTAAFVSIIPVRLSLPPWSSLDGDPAVDAGHGAGSGAERAGPAGVPERRARTAPTLRAVRVAHGDGLQIRGAAGLEDGDVVGCVIADDVGGEAAAGLRHDDPDRRRAADDVVVRQHRARRRQHHAGARSLPILVGEVGVDDDDAAADRRRARLGEREAARQLPLRRSVASAAEDDAGAAAPEWMHARRRLRDARSSTGLRAALRARSPLGSMSLTARPPSRGR